MADTASVVPAGIRSRLVERGRIAIIDHDLAEFDFTLNLGQRHGIFGCCDEPAAHAEFH